MEITAEKNNDVNIIKIPNQLDVLTSTGLKQVLLAVIEEECNIELDFSSTVLVSSAGLRVLLQAEKSAKKAGKTITFTNVSPDVMEIFNITGVNNIFTMRN